MDIKTIKYNPAFLSDDALKQLFVARQTLLESILQTLRENTGGANQHLLIVGSRGMGKTTLVRRIAAAIREDAGLRGHWLPIVFTEESYGVSNAGEFWLEAIYHIAETSGDVRWKQTHRELAGEKDRGRLRERALSQLIGYAEREKKRLLLAVENMEMLFEQIGGEEAWSIRHTLLNEPKIMLLGTALQKFEEVANAEKAMFELFKTHSLERLSAEECAEIWTLITGEKLRAERIRPIQILTGGNPRLVTIISNFGKDISFRELLGDLTRLVDEHTEYFKSHLDVLSAVERKVYAGLLELWEPSAAKDIAAATRLNVNETSAVLARLVAKGAVSARTGRGKAKVYESAERMFNIYWLMRRHGEPSKRIRAVVDFMVHFYGEERIGGIVRAIAEEAQELGPESRELHISAYRAIIYAQSTEQWNAKCMEASPLSFFQLPDVPRDVIKNKVAASFSKGVSLLKAEKYGNAIPCFDEVIGIDPQHFKAWGNKGVALGYMDKLEEAEICFNEAIRLKPDDSDAWFNKGMLCCAKHDFAGAVECYDKAISLNESNERALENKGVVLAKTGKYQEALECFDRAVKIIPGKDSYWENKGAVLMELARYADATAAFEKAIELNPQNIEAMSGRAMAFVRMDKKREALHCFDEVLKIDPTYVLAIGNKGILLGEMGERDRELLCYDKVIEIDPKDFNAWYNKGLTLGMLGRFKEALECVDAAIKINSSDSGAWDYKGVALARMHDLKSAMACFDRAIELAPGNALPVANKGVALFKSGRIDDAIKLFESAVEKDSNMTDGWLGLSRCHIVKEDRVGILDSIQRYFSSAERVKDGMGASITLVEDVAAAGFVEDVLEILKKSPAAPFLEPLIAGLRLYKGEAVSAPTEILEIARDVADKIAKKKQEP